MKLISFLTLAPQFIFIASHTQTYVPIPSDPRFKIQPVVNVQAYTFQPGQVQLLESTFKQAERASIQYLLKIEPDRLLSQFRTKAGLEAKGERYGGWESAGLAGVF